MTPEQVAEGSRLLKEREYLFKQLNAIRKHKTTKISAVIYNENPPYSDKNPHKEIAFVYMDKISLIHELEHQLAENKFKLSELGITVPV